MADLLSKPTQIGYLNGLALTIIVGQLPKLLGFSVDADGLIDEFGQFLQGVADGATNTHRSRRSGSRHWSAILLLQRLMPKIPAVLVAVVLASLAVNALNLEDDGVDTIGVLPQGFPPFTIPDVEPLATSPCCWWVLSPSHSSPSPTRCRPRRRSPHDVVSGCAATRR